MMSFSYLYAVEMIELYDKFIEAFSMPLEYFSDSKKRLYFVYLITSFLLSIPVYLKYRKGSFLKYIFHPKVWLHKSAIVDYLMLIFNVFIKVFFIAPFVYLGIKTQFKVEEILVSIFGEVDFDFGVSSIVIFYTITLWLISDFVSFIIHYLMHRIPFLWEFHKTHHSAMVLNPVTQYRIHPVELLIINFKGLLVYGIVTGAFFYLSKGEVGTITFIGVNIFKFIFLAFGSNLRHSHVKFKFANWLEFILISPFQHQIHHSDNEKHFNKNLGSHLAIWDWLFGTLITSKEVENLSFGLGKENKDFDTIIKVIYTPIKNIFKRN